MRGYFDEVRRAGFDIGVSAAKLARAMVEVLLQLPPEATPSKEVVVRHLGLLGQMAKDARRQRRLEQCEAPSRARATRQILSGWQGPALGDSPGESAFPRETLRGGPS